MQFVVNHRLGMETISEKGQEDDRMEGLVFHAFGPARIVSESSDSVDLSTLSR